jgi:2-C-methyl-D-erythritol 4-phosphate cytidylyltransferase
MRYWVVIPAAGAGRRMSSARPKQYLELAGRTVLEWSLQPFLSRSDVAGIAVALASDDAFFTSLAVARDPRVKNVAGGVERADSVRSALRSLDAADDDFVLVHDAARPCLHPQDLERLIHELQSDDVGGLLACPVSDTLKAGDENLRVTHTPPRDGLWRALTPQMFRFAVLNRALSERTAIRVTDDASAIEAIGLKPKLIPGRVDNIKITVPEDLTYAEFILRERLKA